MINLQKTSGLPVSLNDDNHLKFDAPLKDFPFTSRKFEDMASVWMEKDARPNPAISDMYYMYRDVHMDEHEELIRKNNIRYDITVIPTTMIGSEYNKTVGHYHPVVPGKTLAYPEFYEVLHGEGLFIIQKVDASGKNIEDFRVIHAKPGDKIIYPPNYGHIIVNTGKEPLVTANWVADNFQSIYQPVSAMAGMGYYVVDNGEGGYKLLPNTRYVTIPEPKIIDADENPGFGMSKTEPMYITGTGNPENLKYLNDPTA